MQIEYNNNQPSISSNHNHSHLEIDGSSDQTPVDFLQVSGTSIASLTAPASHVNDVIESSELGSPINLSGSISEWPSVDTIPTPSVSKHNAQAGGPAALTKSPNNSEEALRKLLELRDRTELATWLSQDWVADVYIEYYDVTIDQWRRTMETIEAVGGKIPPQERRSSQKFLVHHAADALRSRCARYVTTTVAKSFWTNDDHDIRFIVRIVDEGRASGRCWERFTRGHHTEYLCTVAYRLMYWLRAMHKIIVATSGMSRWHKANCDRWFKFLRHIRDQRARLREKTATARAPPPPFATLTGESSTAGIPRVPDPAQRQALSPQSHRARGASLEMCHLPALSPAASLERPDIRADLRVTPTLLGNPTHDPAYGDSLDVIGPGSSHNTQKEGRSGEHLHTPSQDDDSKGDAQRRDSQDGQGPVTTAFTSLNTAPVTVESGPFELEQSIDQAHPSQLSSNLNLEIPHVPSYRAPRSKKGMNQMKAIEWMTQPGKDRFEARQDTVLGRWGVTAEHAGTCILVPASWSGLDPQDLVDDFTYEQCPPRGMDKRLVCSGMGYT